MTDTIYVNEELVNEEAINEEAINEEYAIDDMRSEIDTIDEKIAELLVERFGIAVKIAFEKSEKGLSICDSSRENDVLERIRESVSESANGQDMCDDEVSVHIVDIYRTIISETEKYEYELLEKEYQRLLEDVKQLADISHHQAQDETPYAHDEALDVAGQSEIEALWS